MLDDQLYGLVAIAFALGIPFGDLLDMPLAELRLWSAFFARKNAAEELARKGQRGR